MPGPADEFTWIATLRALTLGDPRALDLLDDAAVLPARPGYDLVISKDAMIEGVHFPQGERPDFIARRLLRTSLSDLAAKAASPFGYFLMTAWPPGRDDAYRSTFKQGLAEDGVTFSLGLLGGDTVSTTGPLALSATVLGWTEAGAAVLRSGARAGDVLVVCGDIGDGWLGLQSVQGKLADPDGALARHYRLPKPLLELGPPLKRHAKAAADVSDGLVADAAHIAVASGLGLKMDLGGLPLSPSAVAWLQGQDDQTDALSRLATGGDDYSIACAIDPADVEIFIAEVTALGVSARAVGQFDGSKGVNVEAYGRPVSMGRTGWRHSDDAGAG